jgi:hypothetical protein
VIGVTGHSQGNEKSNILSRIRPEKVTFQSDPKIRWISESQTLILP